MTVKIDGTNGLIQQYDYQVPTTGFSYTFPAGFQVLVMNPAGTLATGTITMPASPADGMTITVESTQQVTAITVNANIGQSIVGAPSQLIPTQSLSWIYRLANTTWYPFFGGAGRASYLVSGTAVNAATGSPTSVDFTGIPSWAKRITVSMVNISTTGASNLLIRIGNTTFTTSGYSSVMNYVNPGANSCTGDYDTTGYRLTKDWAAGGSFTGNMTIVLQYGTQYVATFTGLGGVNGAGFFGSGYVTLASVLDRVRLTTVGGTETFDAGVINILYE